MERFQEARQKAIRNIHIADHILTQTYPLVNDPKLLLAVMENVFLSLTNAMASILHYERLFKRIPPFQDNFDSKFNMFKLKIVNKYKIEKDIILFIQNIKDTIIKHKKSPIEFARKDKFVICSDNYDLKTLSIKDIKEYINKAKLFIHVANNITRENEYIFNIKKF